MSDEKKEELKQIVEQLTNLCLMNGVPLFLLYANETDEGTVYEHSVITPLEAGVKLTDDKITKYSASLNKNLVLSYKNIGIEESMSGDVMDLFLGEE